MNQNNSNEDKFWIENPSLLVKNFNKFIPNRQMTLFQQMNSITLFCIYVLFILHIVGLTNNFTSIIFIGIIVILIILYFNKYNKFNISNESEKFQVESGYYDSDNVLKIGKFYSEKNRNTELDKMVYEISKNNQKILDVKREPTIDNPFMNPILNDFNTENVPYPVNMNDEDIKEKINLTYNKDLFRDLSDLYDSKNVERQFFTIPGGAIPNDQQKFAEWCYKTPYTCKEDSANCVVFDDIRYRNNYK
jgi:hypothetical protein